MGRAPCCEKVGLNKGPWTTEEDRILIDYINENGHGNWRKLPQKAGLLRCGKSCRLRWINYLRPDLKRGDFSKEEEDTLIKLHQALGSKWSAIAKLMPGRTDNEIKNVWNTHLKKQLDHNISSQTKKRPRKRSKVEKVVTKNAQNPQLQNAQDSSIETKSDNMTTSDENSSSVSMASTQNDGPSSSTTTLAISDSLTKFLEIEDDFCWTADFITNDIMTSFNGVQHLYQGWGH